MKAAFYLFRKMTSIFILVAFLLNTITPAGAQLLPAPGTMIGLTSGYQPPMIIGLKIHPENPLLFDFIIDQGAAVLSDDEFKQESEQLVKYFLAALTIPDKEVWVNLSPTEKDRILPDVLGATIMGKTMLEQDYLLKQLASSLTHPEEKMGQEFWAKVKTSAGKSDVPASTFSKVWIVPQKAEVLESDGIVLVGEKRLQVKMADEYEAMKNKQPSRADVASSQIFKEQILPNIEKEVNEGKNFASVRQIYNSVILATWYKKALKESLLGQVYADKGKVLGVESGDKEMKQRIYEQYLAAFKKGAYNLIKEEEDSVTGEMIPRKYFSGGAEFGDTAEILRDRTVPVAVISNVLNQTVSGSSPIKSVTARLAEPGVEKDVVAQRAASPAEKAGEQTTLLLSRDKVFGTFIIESLLETLRELGMTVNNFEIFFGKDMVTGFNEGISDADVYAYIKNKYNSRNDNVFATIDGTDSGFLDAIHTWTEALIQREPQFKGQTPNWLPWVLGAIMQDLASPAGLVGYNLKDRATLIVPLNGGVSSFTEVLLGDQKLVVEFSDTSKGVKIQNIRTGQGSTYPEDVTIVAGRDPVQPDPSKNERWSRFEMKDVLEDTGVSRTHAMIRGYRDSQGRRMIAFRDGAPIDRRTRLAPGEASKAGTFVLTRGVPKRFTNLIPGKASSAVTAVNTAGQSMADLILSEMGSLVMKGDKAGIKLLIERLNFVVGKDKEEGAEVFEDRYRGMTIEQLGEVFPDFIGTTGPGTAIDKSYFVNNKDRMKADGVKGFLDMFSGVYPEGQAFEGTIMNFAGDFVFTNLVNRRKDTFRTQYPSMAENLIARIPAEQFEATLKLKAWVREVLIRSGVTQEFVDSLAASSALGDGMVGEMVEAISKQELIRMDGSQYGASGELSNGDNYVAHLYRKGDQRYTVVEVFRQEETLVGYRIIEGDFLKSSGDELMAMPNMASAPSVSLEPNKASAPTTAPVGGIDFDPTNMNLQIKRDGKGVPLPLPQQNIQQINIEGLVPVIINIVPINAQNLPIFLGQTPKEPGREPELAATAS